MASTQQMQARAKAARKAAKQGMSLKQMTATAHALGVPLTARTSPKDKVYSYGFFYSPKDSVEDVLSITCSDHRGLPLKVGEMMWADDYLAVQDEALKTDPTMVQDLFEQLESVRSYVCSLPNKMVDTRKVAPECGFGDIPLGAVLGLMAGNIAWLASRGHLKQSEYNGTLVATMSGQQGYTPNDVGSHTRTLKSGKVVQVRAYSRGNK